MAHIIDLLSLLINVFGLTGDFKRRVAIVILHLVGAYILAQFFSPVSLFLAEWFSTFLSAQFIATASPGLLKFLSFLLSLIAVILSLQLLNTSIRDFLFTKVEAQMMRKFIEYISSEISIKDATDKALSDIAKDLRPSLKYALIHMSYILFLVLLYYISLGALLLGVCNLFNATFLCPNDAVWQVGAVFLAIHIVHTWLYVTSDGKYSLYSSFQLYVLTGFICQLSQKVCRRKQENQRNVFLLRLSAYVEFFTLTLLASLMPPLPIHTELKTFSAILLPRPIGVNCYGIPTEKDQQNQKCDTSKWQEDEAFQLLLSALKEVAGNTGDPVPCNSVQAISEIIKKLEGKKGISKISQECKADSEFYGPLKFRYYLFQCMVEAIYKAFEKGRVSPHDLLIVAELQLVNGIPVRYEVTKKGREVEIKECYCKLIADQVNETYYPIYLIAAWGDSAEEISQMSLISLCLRLPTHG
jgi:hypothetical protein